MHGKTKRSELDDLFICILPIFDQLTKLLYPSNDCDTPVKSSLQNCRNPISSKSRSNSKFPNFRITARDKEEMDAPAVVVKLKQERESSTTMAHAVNLDRDLKQEESIFVFSSKFSCLATAQDLAPK